MSLLVNPYQPQLAALFYGSRQNANGVSNKDAIQHCLSRFSNKHSNEIFYIHYRNKNKLTNQSLLQVEHNVHLHHAGYLKNTQYFDFYQR